MVQKTQTKNKSDNITISSKKLEAILEELRLLRNEIALLLPQEDLEEYEHPDRIKRSYKNAVKEYPPVQLWK